MWKNIDNWFIKQKEILILEEETSEESLQTALSLTDFNKIGQGYEEGNSNTTLPFDCANIPIVAILNSGTKNSIIIKEMVVEWEF